MSKYKIDLIPKSNKQNKGILPLPLRCLTVGTSGCGKTTLLYNLILKKWGIPFYNLYIFSKSLEQDVYQELKELYEQLSDDKGMQIAYFFNSCEGLISVDDREPNSLVVFDDCVNILQQHTIKDYFRGRHKNISCVYLTQSCTKVDRQLIRNNINFLCIFWQSIKYLKDIYDEYVGSDFTFERLREICNLCWNEDYGFLTIDTTKQLSNRRYRKKLEEQINAKHLTPKRLFNLKV